MNKTKQSQNLLIAGILKKRYGISLASILVFLSYKGTAGTSQTIMAEQLGITRTTIRKAIIELEIVGLAKVIKERKKITDIMFMDVDENGSQLGL